jgi:DNA-binding XRE family transcriptional regulator
MHGLATQVKRNHVNNVQILRLKAGYRTQKEFSEVTNISPTILNAIESNRKFLSSVYAIRIAEVLGCTIDELFSRKTARLVRPLKEVNQIVET